MLLKRLIQSIVLYIFSKREYCGTRKDLKPVLQKKDYFIAKTQHEPAALAHIYNNYGCLSDEE